MGTEFSQSQENRNPESIVEEVAGETESTFPPISGFWRRLFAWIIDVLILGAVGQIFGLIFSNFLFSLGPYGRPIGLLFIIPYFGILNSNIGGGQTLGKRTMKIAVRNKDNETIGLWRSILRIFLLSLPSLFNQWSIPIFQNPAVMWFLSLIVFGLGGTIFYSMVFNHKSRQGIHDLLLGTYVVHLPGKPISMFPVTPKIHWIISSALIGCVAIGSLVMIMIAPTIISKTPIASVMSLQNSMSGDPRFFNIGVVDNTIYNFDGKNTHSLIITVWYKGKFTESNNIEVVDSIVKTILENTEGIENYDRIEVKVTSAYDIGIARANFSVSMSDTLERWRKHIYPNGIPIGIILPSLGKTLAIFEYS